MLGGEHLIFLSDYETIKEAFNKDSMNFRPTGSEDFRRAYADFKGIYTVMSIYRLHILKYITI